MCAVCSVSLDARGRRLAVSGIGELESFCMFCGCPQGGLPQHEMILTKLDHLSDLLHKQLGRKIAPQLHAAVFIPSWRCHVAAVEMVRHSRVDMSAFSFSVLFCVRI